MNISKTPIINSMKLLWIVILYKTPQSVQKRLEQEISAKGIKVIFIDNIKSKKGYAAGVNEGIKQGLRQDFDAFIISNFDISVGDIKTNDIIEGLKHFDILGFTMKQNGKIYYGGELDKWRMSGGLVTKKPSQRYSQVDFVSGSLMVIKRNVIDNIGLFDESYGMYYEDVDYCIRAKRAGFKVGIDSKTKYDHFETSDEHPEKAKWLAQNRSKFLWKYGSWKLKLYEIIRLPKTLYEHLT